MAQLFKKAACFTDLHLGNKNNSLVHNQDCEEFIDWYIATAKKHNCDTGVFLGDFHHNRNNMNIVTMNYSIRILEKLGQAFDQFFFLIGNHDIYMKDSRDIHSVLFGKHIPGITIINHPIQMDNVVLCPWLVGDEWRQLAKMSGQYIFGHFELPTFYMNSKVQMPAHGEFTLDKLTEYALGFSGHFHLRQSQKNMHYIGNAFPHNYADAWDDERGMMILEWDQQPEYYTWDAQPTFRTIKLSKLIDEAESILKPRQFLRVSLDVDISFEEAAYIKEQYISNYQLRELVLVAEKAVFDVNDILVLEECVSVDQVVNRELTAIETNKYNPTTLLDIYNSL